MKRSGLQQLAIRHIRGSTLALNLKFENTKNLTIVYGENGTGKSSICDALDYYANKNVGSLVGRGLGNNLKRFWPALGKSLDDIDVNIVPKDNFFGGSPLVKILRRRQVLSLIEAEASSRYEFIRAFIDVSGIESSETSLRSLLKSSQAELKLEEIKKATCLAEIKQHHTANAPEGTISALEWAKNISNTTTEEFSEATSYIDSLSASFDKIRTLSDKRNSESEKTSQDQDLFNTTKSRLQTLLSLAVNGTEESIAVLEAAQKYFAKNTEINECPLCKSKENILGLAESVAQQIEKLKEIRSTQQSANEASAVLLKSKDALAKTETELLTAINTFNDLLDNKKLPNGLNLARVAPTDFVEIVSWIDKTTTLNTTWKEHNSTSASRLTTFVKIKAEIDKLDKTEEKIVSTQKLLGRINEVIKLIEYERKNYIDKILGTITGKVSNLYLKVHPEEGLNNISLFLDPKKRSSLEIDASFHDSKVPPQAYFSDSHLDTLGLCIFISLAELEKPQETIIVLDDVITSVDDQHADRLIEMLYDESENFAHCILTTHYKPWKEKYRWGLLKTNHCQFIELAQWDKANGIRLKGFTPELEALKHYLEQQSIDAQIISSKAGIILEQVLDYITMRYECSLPRRATSLYTINEYLSSIKRKLRDALKVEVLTTNHEKSGKAYETHMIGEIIDTIEKMYQARNAFGCHYNPTSHCLPDSDAVKFSKLVLQIASLIIDPNSGWPKINDSGMFWATPGQTRRLYPLLSPK